MTDPRTPVQVTTDAIFHELTRFPSREAVDRIVARFRVTVLAEAAAAIDAELEAAAARCAEAFERGYDKSILSAATNQCGALRDAKTAVERLMAQEPLPSQDPEQRRLAAIVDAQRVIAENAKEAP